MACNASARDSHLHRHKVPDYGIITSTGIALTFGRPHGNTIEITALGIFEFDKSIANLKAFVRQRLTHLAGMIMGVTHTSQDANGRRAAISFDIAAFAACLSKILTKDLGKGSQRKADVRKVDWLRQDPMLLNLRQSAKASDSYGTPKSPIITTSNLLIFSTSHSSGC
jgi:hypothetical protein